MPSAMACRVDNPVRRLSRIRHHEDVVVHGQTEQDDEQEQPQPRHDGAVGGEAERILGAGLLEHQDQRPVRRRHGEQVQRRSRQGDHHGPERQHQDQHCEHQHEADHYRQALQWRSGMCRRVSAVAR
jgi:hypothetical protein